MAPFSYLFSKADKCFPLQYPWGRVGNSASLYRQHEFSKQQLVFVSAGLSWLTTANHSRIAVEGCTDVRLQFLIASLHHRLYFWCLCESVWVYAYVNREGVGLFSSPAKKLTVIQIAKCCSALHSTLDIKWLQHSASHVSIAVARYCMSAYSMVSSVILSKNGSCSAFFCEWGHEYQYVITNLSSPPAYASISPIGQLYWAPTEERYFWK